MIKHICRFHYGSEGHRFESCRCHTERQEVTILVVTSFSFGGYTVCAPLSLEGCVSRLEHGLTDGWWHVMEPRAGESLPADTAGRWRVAANIGGALLRPGRGVAGFGHAHKKEGPDIWPLPRVGTDIQ